MKKSPLRRRLMSMMLVVAMLSALLAPTAYAAPRTPAAQPLRLTEIDPAGLDISRGDVLDEPTEAPSELHSAREIVRVAIVMDSPSTLDIGYPTERIAQNDSAMTYRRALGREQDDAAARISRTTGSELDVQWNLTLAANIISANVRYGDIEKIRQVDGVASVEIETLHYPQAPLSSDSPNMGPSAGMIGSTEVWSSGHTGAGSRLAVIDTGLDHDHQSFDADAFMYALRQDAILDLAIDDSAPISAEDEARIAQYIEDLELLDQAEILSVLSELNMSRGSAESSGWTVRERLAAEQLYRSAKLPFNYNYVDRSYDTDHLHDTKENHGSHVSGIAAANRFIKTEENGETVYQPALDYAKVQGAAPDAQLFVMKVFGAGGGAYDSDYMVAIEDAILLGADAVNLSLGSGYAGAAFSPAYQTVMDRLASTNTDTVVAISAGNSGAWYDDPVNKDSYPAPGLVYIEDVNMATGGQPGSFNNSLTVASFDNIGSTGKVLSFGALNVLYRLGNPSPEFTDIIERDSEGNIIRDAFDFVLADGIGSEAEFAALGAELLGGKVVMCRRGEINFSAKANNAAALGAAAVIIYNNQPGSVTASLSGYTGTVPVATISQADAEAIMASAAMHAAEGDAPAYYTGNMRVGDSLESVITSPDSRTVSSFSSWGNAGALLLKPDISAPGGGIYSVKGLYRTQNDITGGHDEYENMSGTSMAAPQITGMSALLGQYLRGRFPGGSYPGGVSKRQLMNSLLMSTAIPAEESAGNYYPVMRQGAGLANIAAAIRANSYVMMDSGAVLLGVSAADGKVKVELGDDPQRSGSYTFAFTLNNMDDNAKTYTLDTRLFTQARYSDGDGVFMDTETMPLAADAVYSGEGVSGAALTLPAGGSVTVTVTAQLTAEQLTELTDGYPNGAYIQGYTFITPDDADADSVHSIPILGFFGSWSDPSMFDAASSLDALYGVERGRENYLGAARTNNLVVTYPREPDVKYLFRGNPYGAEESGFPADRLALAPDTLIQSFAFSHIRAAGTMGMAALSEDSGKVVWKSSVTNNRTAPYYNINNSTWVDTEAKVFKAETTPAAMGLRAGRSYYIGLFALPEYYTIRYAASSLAANPGDAAKSGLTADEFRTVLDNRELFGIGAGASLGYTFVIDDERPVVRSAEGDAAGASLTLTASDNEHIAYIAVMSESGSTVFASHMPEGADKSGEDYTYTFDLSAARIGKRCSVLVADYAGNETAYAVDYDPQGDELFHGLLIGFTGSEARGSSGARWIELEGDTLAYVSESEHKGVSLLSSASVKDIRAAEYAMGYVFMVAGDRLYAATVDDLGMTRDIGRLTLNGVAALSADVNLDGETNDADAQTILDYIVAPSEYSGSFERSAADLDGDGEITSYDAQLLLNWINGVETDKLGVIRDMAFNRYDGRLYALNDDNIIFIIDVNTARVTRVHKLDAGEGVSLAYLAIDDEGTFYVAGVGGADEAKLYKWSGREALTPQLALKPVGTLGAQVGANGGAMAWDHAESVLYLASSGSAELNAASMENILYTVDAASGAATRTNENAVIYANVTGLLAVPADGGELPPAENATELTVAPAELTLFVGMSRELSYEIFPWTLGNKNVIWESENTDYVTVEQNGTVTAVGTRTNNSGVPQRTEVTVTARSAATPTVSASCKITVLPRPRALLNGIYTDAEGVQHWIAFDTDDLAGYTDTGARLSVDVFSGAALGDKLYAMDETNTVWRIDADTLVSERLTQYSGDEYRMLDMAPLHPDYYEALGNGATIVGAVPGKRFAHDDPENSTGTPGISSWSYKSDDFAAIAQGPRSSSSYEYYTIAENGKLYYITLSRTYGDFYSPFDIGSTGLTLGSVSDFDSRASMYYDEASGGLFLSSYKAGKTTLYVIDTRTATAMELGTLDGPLVALHQYDRAIGLQVKLSSSAISGFAGETHQLSAAVANSGEANPVIKWSSADESIATVDENGLVTFVKRGSTVITAKYTAADGETVSAECAVTVHEIVSMDIKVRALYRSAADAFEIREIDLSDGSYAVIGTLPQMEYDYYGTLKYAIPDFRGGAMINGELYGALYDAQGKLGNAMYRLTPPAAAGGEYTPELLAAFSTYGFASDSYAISDGAYLPEIAYSGGSIPAGSIWTDYYVNYPALVYVVPKGDGTLERKTMSMLPSYGDPNTAYGGIAYIGKNAADAPEYYVVALDAASGEFTLYKMTLSGSYSSYLGARLSASFEALGSFTISGVTTKKPVSLEYITDGANSVLLMASSADKTIYRLNVTDTGIEAEILASFPEAKDLTMLHMGAFSDGTGALPAQPMAQSLRRGESAAPASLGGSSGSAEKETAEVTLTEDVDSANGLIVAEYDPDALTFVSCEGALDYKAFHVDEANGTITFAYASRTAIGAGETMAKLIFSHEGHALDTAVTLITRERNNVLDPQEPAVPIPLEAGKLIYTVSFDGSGAEGSMEAVEAPRGESFTVPECGFTAPENTRFGGWSTKADGAGTVYQPGESFIPEEDVTLYAIWQKGVRFVRSGAEGSSLTAIKILRSAQFDPKDTHEPPSLGYDPTMTSDTVLIKYGDSPMTYTEGNVELMAGELMQVRYDCFINKDFVQISAVYDTENAAVIVQDNQYVYLKMRLLDDGEGRLVLEAAAERSAALRLTFIDGYELLIVTPGDVNFDGRVNSNDWINIMRWTLSGTGKDDTRPDDPAYVVIIGEEKYNLWNLMAKFVDASPDYTTPVNAVDWITIMKLLLSAWK